MTVEQTLVRSLPTADLNAIHSGLESAIQNQVRFVAQTRVKENAL